MKEVCLEYVHLSIFFSSSFFLFWPVWKPEVDVFFVGGHRLPWGFYSRLFCLHCGTSRIFGNILSFLAHIYIFTCILRITTKKTGRGSEYTAVFSPLIDVDIFDKWQKNIIIKKRILLITLRINIFKICIFKYHSKREDAH